MKKQVKKIIYCLFLCVMAVAYVGCQQKKKQAEENKGEIFHKIGVAVFDQENPELRMFMNYYRNYIEEGFPVQFIFSSEIASTDDEISFIMEAKEMGAEGIISFYGLGIEDIVKTCEQEKIYYLLGSGTLSEDDFNRVKSNEWFLGTIGPKAEEETKAGQDMAKEFMKEGKSSYLILSGGSCQGNYMHYERTRGMLNELAEVGGFSYEKSVEEYALSSENTEVKTNQDKIKIMICPGYPGTKEGNANLSAARKTGSYDCVMASVGITSVLNRLLAYEAGLSQNMLIGTIDCFSQENLDAVLGDDPRKNPQIDYVKGKYGSMVGPAFAAMYNALEGDMDVIRPNHEAFRLYQEFWEASGREQYEELYYLTENIYENAYSCVDLMKVIKAYNENADFDGFRQLTEASDLESVKKRMEN